MNNFDASVKIFNDFASEYADRFMDIESYRIHFDKFRDLIDTSEPDILELGCGPANVTRYLKQSFPQSKILALDLAPRMIEIAKRNLQEVDYRVMDVRDIKTLDLTFNSIMCSFCLPFLSKQDAEKLISDCSIKLKKNGVLYLSTMEGDETKSGFESTSFSGDSQVFFYYHRQSDIENSLQKNGFSIEYNVRQNYYESDGTITIDLIMIAKKK